MSEHFDACLTDVLRHEGGYVDNAADPGGATNRGVTLAVLSEWRGHPVTKADVQALTLQEASAIYRKNYWLAASCDKLPAGVDAMVFDLAVNSGVGRACRFLQEALGVAADGHLGPVSLAAAAKANPVTIVDKMAARREAFYRAQPTFSTFGKGWLRRLDEVTAMATGMTR